MEFRTFCYMLLTELFSTVFYYKCPTFHPLQTLSRVLWSSLETQSSFTTSRSHEVGTVLPQRTSPWLLFFVALEAYGRGQVFVDGVSIQTWPIFTQLKSMGSWEPHRENQRAQVWNQRCEERLEAFTEPGIFPPQGSLYLPVLLSSLSSLKCFSPDIVVVYSLTSAALCSSVTAPRGPRWLFQLNQPFPACRFPVPFALLHSTIHLLICQNPCLPSSPPPAPFSPTHVSAS